VFFPRFGEGEWRLMSSKEPHPADEKNAFPFTFCVYERKKLPEE
jgi:hypothetical protein